MPWTGQIFDIFDSNKFKLTSLTITISALYPSILISQILCAVCNVTTRLSWLAGDALEPQIIARILHHTHKTLQDGVYVR